MVNTFKYNLLKRNTGKCNSRVFNLTNTLTFYVVNVMVLLIVSCKEHYDPPVTPLGTHYLVVEGFINAKGVTGITISRTLPLQDSAKIKPELNARVTILAENNSVNSLKEKGSGLYVSDSLTLNKNIKYRLDVKTNDGKEYQSAFVPIKLTPPIDSVSWKPDNGGIHIFVNTHDPRNQSLYYKWDYEETWEIHSTFHSQVVYENGFVHGRPDSEIAKLFYCWGSHISTNINLASSQQLTRDVISEMPLVSIPSSSEKISVRYSILVKQATLDKQGYEFYQLMKKNTESIGSVFDALPSENFGNIVSVSNPSEKVIGNIIASTIEQKRIFVLQSEIPRAFYSQNCPIIKVTNDRDSFKLYYDGYGLLPYAPIGYPPKEYYSSIRECMDCRLRGSSIKPSFW